MREQLGNLVDVVVGLIDVLEHAGVAYALGGAIAYSAWAEPRATRDIDLNVWVEDDQLANAFDVLARAGIAIDRSAAVVAARERGMFVAYHGDYRIDVYLPSVPFYAEALRRRRRVHLAGRETWVLSPESLAVFKMLFFRPKDLVDVARICEIQGASFDRAFVRQALVDIVGAQDERVRKWEEIAAGRRP